MAVTSEDLRSLLAKVKKSDSGFPPPLGKQAGSKTPVPPSAAKAEPASSPAAAAAAVAAPADPPPLEAPTDLADLASELEADEELLRRTLGLLYREKKANPNQGFVGIIDLEKRLGLAREGGAFILNYMKSLKLVEPDDKSRVAITVEGIDYIRKVLASQS